MFDQNLCDGLLNQTILYSGDTQHTHAAIRFWNVPRASQAKGCTSLPECERRCSPNGGESALRARRRSFRLRPEHLCWLSPAYMPGACSAARGLSPVRSLTSCFRPVRGPFFPLLSAFGLTSFSGFRPSVGVGSTLQIRLALLPSHQRVPRSLLT